MADGEPANKKSGGGFGAMLDKIGAGLKGAGGQAGGDARGLLSRWRPSRPQQLVLLGVLTIAFLELRIANKFGDIWTMAFTGGKEPPTVNSTPANPPGADYRSMLP